MAISNYVPEIWDGELLVAFRKVHVFAPLVNRNYEGQIQDKGDVVRITTPAAINVNAYSGSVSYQTPTSAQQSLVIDQDYYWAFDLDDLEKVQSDVELVRPYMEEAGYSLADTVDGNIAALYTSAGLDSISLDLGTDDFYDKLVEAGKQLSEANVPKVGRWAVVTPAGHADLLKNDAFIRATALGDNTVVNGMIGRAAGFDIYESNNLVNTTAATYAYMYGTNAAITFALQHTMSEGGRREGSFKDFTRGRHVWGRKVVRPSALGVILADQT